MQPCVAKTFIAPALTANVGRCKWGCMQMRDATSTQGNHALLNSKVWWRSPAAEIYVPFQTVPVADINDRDVSCTILLKCVVTREYKWNAPLNKPYFTALTLPSYVGKYKCNVDHISNNQSIILPDILIYRFMRYSQCLAYDGQTWTIIGWKVNEVHAAQGDI